MSRELDGLAPIITRIVLGAMIAVQLMLNCGAFALGWFLHG
jgi:hypothetical protein